MIPQPEEHWVHRGRCRHVPIDPETFFAQPGSREERIAMQFCQDCPVRLPCQLEALQEPDLQGVWGGLNWASRRKLMGLRVRHV